MWQLFLLMCSSDFFILHALFHLITSNLGGMSSMVYPQELLWVLGLWCGDLWSGEVWLVVSCRLWYSESGVVQWNVVKCDGLRCQGELWCAMLCTDLWCNDFSDDVLTAASLASLFGIGAHFIACCCGNLHLSAPLCNVPAFFSEHVFLTVLQRPLVSYIECCTLEQ